MKHSDLKVGMKVKRVANFSNIYHTSSEGSISTVKDVSNYYFSTIEDSGSWDAEYFEPVEYTKEESQMQKITMDKKYRTRCGYPARVLCVDMKKNNWPVVCVVEYPDGSEVMNNVTINGKEWNNEEEYDLDLIEVSPWEDFKKDDKVMVREFTDEEWVCRHFSHADIESGKVYCYNIGKTSFTTKDTSSWKYCRKPTQEELEG